MNPSALPTGSLATLREWFDLVPDAMVAADFEGNILLANAPAERMFGYAHDAMPGLNFEALLPESLREAHRQRRRAYAANPRLRPMGIDIDLEGVRCDGQRFPMEAELSPIATERGVIGIISLRNVSGSPHVRQALARARRDNSLVQIGRLALESPDYEHAIRRIPEVVAAALEVPSVAILSTAWQRSELGVRAATGLSGQAVEALASLFGNADAIRGTFEAGPRNAVGSEALQSEPFAQIRATLAKAGFVDAAMVPLFGRHEPLGVLVVLATAPVGFGDDAVGFLQAVASLLVAAVQRSRSEEQLAHAQRLEAIGQLTGGVAHDFNNLLTAISGNLQLLETELPDNPQAQELIQSALRAVARGAHLTRSLLAVARRQPLQPRVVVPRPLLEDLGQMLGRTLGSTISIEIRCPADVPDLYADPNELYTALVNLALNARDAMPRGGHLAIMARGIVVDDGDKVWKLAPGHYVAFKVSDTGTGMPLDVQARALEPFFTTKGAGKGSGLGLSMVYGFATQSGGGVQIESRLGYGTRVELLLPVAHPEAAGAEDATAPGDVARAPNEIILVVEDEPDVRAVAVMLLRGIGYDVVAAASAHEALKMLSAHPHVDLLFSDVVLGSGMNGIELAREARRIRPDLAVLLTSGYPGPEDQRPAAGSTDAFVLLRKPYRREDLVNAVRQTLEHA